MRIFRVLNRPDGKTMAAQHELLAEVHAAWLLTDSIGAQGSQEEAAFIPMRFQCQPHF